MNLNNDKVPRYMDFAEREVGQVELAGNLHNPRILAYHDTTTLGDWGKSRDETPWCSSFVNWCVIQGGLEGTNNALARSWLRWGEPASGGYRYGDVAVIKRRGTGADRRTGSRGGYHVGFFIRDGMAGIRLLGGNQRDSVRFSTYSHRTYDVLDIRRCI